MTLDEFEKMIPTCKQVEQWFPLAQEFFPKYEIVTPLRIAGFMAQGGHESLDFNVLHENLNYSAEGLLKTFPRYFKTASMAQSYARKPKDIANYVYDDANRKSKLGNTNPGDGWLYRGRGIFQLTGFWNYEAFGKTVGMSASDAAAYVGTKRGAMDSACWFWNMKNGNRFADSSDITGMSKAINGGDIGLSDRISRWNRNRKIISTGITQKPSVSGSQEVFLRRGQPRSENVKLVQRKLGLTADGIFGKNTEEAVRNWQRKKSVAITGYLSFDQFQELVD